MFDSDIHGTTLEAIAADLTATAKYLLEDRDAGAEEKERTAVSHVTAALSMLNDMLDDIEDEDE